MRMHTVETSRTLRESGVIRNRYSSAVVMAVACAAGFIAASPSIASMRINAMGAGTARVTMWRAAALPPAAPTYDFTTGNGVAPCWFNGPGAPLFHPTTAAESGYFGVGSACYVANDRTWSDAWTSRGGDWASPGGDDLVPLVTPSAAESTGFVHFSFTVNPSDVTYTGTMSVSDCGSAARVRWFDLNNPGTPLRERLLIGSGTIPRTQSFNEIFLIPAGGPANLVIEVDGIGASLSAPVPTLSAWGMIVLGVLLASASMVVLARRRIGRLRG
jgi:hypothetical protein